MPITPNMTLDLPSVSVTLGPEWATLLNAAFSLVDSHDHSDGKGVKVTQNGINITGNLDLNEAYLVDVGSMRLVSQEDVLSTPQDIRAIYSVNGDLYYNNSSGTAIQITSGGSVTAASDGIARRFERASVNSNTVISAASTVSYYDTDTTSGVTYTLPSAAGVAAGRFYEFKDTTGSAGTNNIVINRAGSDTIDGATSFTINLNYGAIRLISDGTSKWAVSRPIVDTDQIRNLAVTTAKIADANITTVKIADGNVTQAKRAALGQQISSSCGSFTTSSGSYVDVTNLSVTITTTGRPVVVKCIPDGTSSRASMGVSASATTTARGEFQILRDATTIAVAEYGIQGASGNLSNVSAPALNTVDTPAAGTYTYKVQAKAVVLTPTVQCVNVKLIAYEL